MPLASLDDLQQLARRGAPLFHDEYSERALHQRWEEYLPRRREAVGKFRLTVDGEEFPTFYPAVLDERRSFADVAITLRDPPSDPTAWDYLVPFRSLRLSDDGACRIEPLREGDPTRRAIARFLLLDHFIPRSQLQDTAASRGSVAPLPITELAPVQVAVRFLRGTGIVPLSIALLLYQSDLRTRFEIDLTGSEILRDPRAGRLPLTRWVHRPPRVAHAIDAFVARGELSPASARALEILSETHGLNAVEFSHVVGTIREMGKSALDTLVARRLATLDKRTGIYRPRLEAFWGPTERVTPPEKALPPLPNPELRSSVLELLNAADSRATCPLCGDPLPARRGAILCDRCQAEVSGETA